jgi:hypothetical protein
VGAIWQKVVRFGRGRVDMYSLKYYVIKKVMLKVKS